VQDEKMTNGVEQSLVQVWVSVTAADGTTRLESRWASVEPALAVQPTYAA
jgi:hypothetical protein